MGVGILIYNSTITTLGNMLDVITATAEWKDWMEFKMWGNWKKGGRWSGFGDLPMIIKSCPLMSWRDCQYES